MRRLAEALDLVRASRSRLAKERALADLLDPLRDEGEAYAKKLAAAGVEVEHRNDGGMFHGYFSCGGGIDVARDALDHSVRALRRALARR